ncbi:hypothetical protein BaOVIS_010250 [Babesia ovis]|uniref:CCR4-NOT transcription complex subunit 4 n=1 Tax=Babesia ovis TaxID=5869 RepID=A0A9W5WU76_BABOV|nr:hypothetical protein BaOVIS_010250 [Babesia ovis]
MKMLDGRKADAAGKDADDELLCPLCMEVLDETDRNFYPCTCDYQVCLWCLHYLRTTMGNKCPACRRDYDESTMKYKTIPRTQVNNRAHVTKKRRDPGDKDATTRDDNGASPRHRNTQNLREMRVIQRNLVYVVGIPAKLAKKEILKQHEYFGQYGKIQHIVINKSQAYNAHVGGASYTAYITYSKKYEAANAIQAIDGSYVNGKLLRASYGTTKYCTFFLKGLKCNNVDCFYLHRYGDESERISKEELTNLMHKAVKSGIGLGPHALENATMSKIHLDAANRSMDNEELDDIAKEAHLAQMDDDGVDAFTGHHLGVPSERDSSSWANVASGFKTGNDRTDSGLESLYRHTDDLHYTLAGMDSFSNDFDTYRSQKIPSDFQTSNSFVNGYLSTSDPDSNVRIGALDQHEMMKRLLGTSLLVEMERYNRGDHIIYAEEIPLRKDKMTSKLRLRQDEMVPDDSSTMMGVRWIPSSDALDSVTCHMANKRRQIDGYKGANQVSSSGDGDQPVNTTASTVNHKDIFPEDALIENIMAKVKHHMSMMDAVTKLYQSDGTLADVDVLSPKSSVAHENRGTLSDGDITPIVSSVITSMTVVSPNEPHQELMAEMYVETILDTSLLPESQLFAEMKLHEQLSEHVNKLLEAQNKRDSHFMRHLSELYAS